MQRRRAAQRRVAERRRPDGVGAAAVGEALEELPQHLCVQRGEAELVRRGIGARRGDGVDRRRPRRLQLGQERDGDARRELSLRRQPHRRPLLGGVEHREQRLRGLRPPAERVQEGVEHVGLALVRLGAHHARARERELRRHRLVRLVAQNRLGERRFQPGRSSAGIPRPPPRQRR